MDLHPPGALARSHLSSPPSLNSSTVGGSATTPANDDDDMYDASASITAQAPAAPTPPAPGGNNGGSSSSPKPWPKLKLDSGASIHCVGDPKLLSNLRDAPAGMTIRVANGGTLPVTKIGDIQMASAGFRIADVHLAPGLKSDVISVNQLARQSRIRAWFDGDRAKLYAGCELVGVAVAPRDRKYSQYILESLSVPEIAAASSAGTSRRVLPQLEPEHFM